MLVPIPLGIIIGELSDNLGFLTDNKMAIHFFQLKKKIVSNLKICQ